MLEMNKCMLYDIVICHVLDTLNEENPGCDNFFDVV